MREEGEREGGGGTDRQTETERGKARFMNDSSFNVPGRCTCTRRNVALTLITSPDSQCVALCDCRRGFLFLTHLYYVCSPAPVSWFMLGGNRPIMANFAHRKAWRWNYDPSGCDDNYSCFVMIL